MSATVIPATVHAEARHLAVELRRQAIDQAFAWLWQRLWPKRRAVRLQEQTCQS